MNGKLILENGIIFEGNCFGKIHDTVGEVVFNTGMTGYQEVLTDPSYYGQIITMTYPLIGNYGINLEDNESDTPKVRGFIVREKASLPNNFRCELDLESYLKQNNIMAIEGIDTRQLTKVIRDKGTMKGIITVNSLTQESINHLFDSFDNSEAVKNVTTKNIKNIDGDGLHIGIMDFGIKENIIRLFKNKGCKITVFPAFASCEEILSKGIDGVFLSNGPGNPEDLTSVIENIKKMIGVVPITGICLGHQLLALALGAKTEKMNFGHRGCNHPVKNLRTGKVTITSQNHGYMVNKDSLTDDIEVTHINMNDMTVEGMRHKKYPIYCVQYHPEACPGPYDSNLIFDEFIELYREFKINK